MVIDGFKALSLVKKGSPSPYDAILLCHVRETDVKCLRLWKIYGLVDSAACETEKAFSSFSQEQILKKVRVELFGAHPIYKVLACCHGSAHHHNIAY